MKKIKKALYQFAKFEGGAFLMAFGVFALIFVLRKPFGISFDDLLDWTIFLSMLFAVVASGIAKAFNRWILNILEDDIKLTTDYDKLVLKYRNEMLRYNNSTAKRRNLRKLFGKKSAECTIPIIFECDLTKCEIQIYDDNQSQYQCPEIIQAHAQELLSAHAFSKVYNQLCVRVNEWKLEKNVFVMYTSRTTYYDSLMTNRVMDFRWNNSMTVREKFEFGPLLHDLQESQLSNHLGYNGFIESDDGYIVFVKRDGNFSIGKRTYGNSVGASLKTRYALDENGKFDEVGLGKAILKEIEDELKIPEKEISDEFSLEKNLIAAYRDVLEGGKPQLLFYVKSEWKKDKIEKNFKEKSKKKNIDMLQERSKLLWIQKTDLSAMCILPDRIIHKGKSYHMLPSATGSVVLLLKYLKEND